MKKALIFSSFFIWSLSLFPANRPSLGQKKEPLSQLKDVLTIEKNLFELTNKERKDHSLPPLSLSPDLSRLARLHSQDMAKDQRLSHLSSSGKSYEGRLADAGFYHISLGENVAFSETFVAEFAHQGLMKSPEHRENILNPSFDQIGIGVVLVEDKGYYITQDFLQSLELQEEEVVKKEIQKKINDLRRENGLPPLIFSKEADAHAQKFSQQKREDAPPSPRPSNFGETHIIYVSSPSLAEAQSVYQDKILDRIYEQAGLSVSFDRNTEYPGGSYFVTLILLPENRYKDLNKDELRRIILLNLNEVRQKKGLAILRLDKSLTASAERALKKITQGRTPLSLPPASMTQLAFWSYTTDDPTLLPKELEDRMEKDFIYYLNIGIGITFKKTKEFPRGTFWVTLFLER